MSNECTHVVYDISDADEPDYLVELGMQFCSFDGVTLVLLPDDEAGEMDWYGTGLTDDGRPTRPVLLFYKGLEPTAEEAVRLPIAIKTGK